MLFVTVVAIDVVLSNSDAQPRRRSDTDKVTRCTLFGKRVAQLGDMPRHTSEFDARVKVAR